jgi:hypothetical protein
MSFTDEQQNFINIILEKELNKECGILCLNSPAGTGKTHCIKYLCQILKEKIILAPTNKAISLIRKDIPYNSKAYTIHRFLNCEQDIDIITGEIEFIYNNCSLLQYTIIIIDEASMVDKEMFEKFKEISENHLVIYCGDKYQIPPNNELKSLVFTIKEQLKFTKNFRSNKSIDKNYIIKFRNAVRNLAVVKINDKFPIDNLLQQYEDIDNDNVILAWTNARVGYWNNLIRNHLYKESNIILKEYYINEKLIFSGYRKCKYDISYYSSDEIIISDISEVELDIQYPVKYNIPFATGMGNLNENIAYKIKKIKFYK